jgi:hexosaminidase
MRKLALMFLAGMVLQGASFAQQISIVPEPAEMTLPKTAAKYVINSITKINLVGSGLEESASFLNDYIQKVYGFKLAVVPNGKSAGITLSYEKQEYRYPGAYRMQVGNKGVNIAGDNANGVFYGVQTLIQLLPTEGSKTALQIPHVNIKDYPRFGYRGMHLDVSRHFFDVNFVKKYIDYLALHKMNYFHWHLTDDQGWRIEIKKYPKLTEVGGWRNGTIVGRYPGTGNDNIRVGGFYTQDEIREVVKYAADRYITVVPEIEMPGHASAAIAAYPELSCFPGEATKKYVPENCAWAGDSTGKQVIQSWGVYDDVFVPSENTFKFLEDVVDEVIALFPSKYIHVGGDECPKTNWKRSEFCQNLIKEKGLKDEHGLQSYFINRMEKYINSKGRTIIGWDEILEGGLAPNALVMSWRGEEGGIAAAKENHEVIMTPGNFVYFDHSQTRNEDSVTIGGYTPLEETYSYEPVPAALPADKHKYILGAQANLWTEYVKNPSKVEYMVFPRMSALSEVLWSPASKRNWKSFEKKIPAIFNRYGKWGSNYSKSYFDLKANVVPAAANKGLQVKLESPIAAAQPVYILEGAGSSAATTTKYNGPLSITSNAKLTAWNELKGKPAGAKVQLNFTTNKATGKKISLQNNPSKNYPGQGGAFGLVNGLRSEKGMNSTEWLGWEGSDLDATIDLGESTSFEKVQLHIAESHGSWIYGPAKFEISVSDDGNNYKAVTAGQATSREDGNSMKSLEVSFPALKARFVKVKAVNYGQIPDGQAGAGHKAWLFADEISIQ